MKEKIRQLAKEKNAIILAHNYQPPEIQDIADLCGDSLELSIKAARTDAQIIVFCGVHFMAETACILCPEKTVLLPAPDAGCPMADMVDPQALSRRKQELGNIPVITYVNSSAAVKAVSDICCTSANVIKVVNSIDAQQVLMTPDKNLARYAAAHTDKQIHLWEGYCPFHNTLTAQDVKKARQEHPDALFIAHPECPPQVLELADSIQSTSGMIQFAGESTHTSFILGTENGLLYPISKAHPDKTFYAASEKMLCPDMKKITLENLADSLENLTGQVTVPEDIRIKALGAVQKMIAL
ncbi:MAG: quinolinate synthase NadA [Proteobacteria bacterium]|nr:quinolinate synthase NadA [Pseudomonadota bacterium]MBU1386225.1 quinolinate synthase NadA [Pseudomonadota bacterium]MBU1542918.1 quinolinate synthase NadA [Pseudomonadota bacterium]MBU2431392.1 quinolinate synthase NadA [Pseudomonadota bacterium]MBU2479880.1 quinolinate synthase NadA [Pseudomonadota bacterium]